ncbi:MAG TPA: hypothetical protein VLB50_02045 [Ignavibacteriaceae bacterium]|nr:hypothetical protein [Ignavibacteriaceae bacterium]
MFTKWNILILLFCSTSTIYPINETDTTKTIKSDSLKSNYHTLGEKNQYIDPAYGYPEIFLRFDKKNDDTLKKAVINAKYDSLIIVSGESDNSGINYRFPLGIKKSKTFESDLSGISFLGIDEIPETDYAIINGLTFSLSLGNMGVDGASSKFNYHIYLNGIHFSLLLINTVGDINGFAFGGFYGLGVNKLNGIGLGGIAAYADTLNGIGIGAGGCGGHQVNGIILGGICNFLERLNGISIASINTKKSFTNSEQDVNGLIMGLLNFIDVNGLTIGLLNSGNSWIQIGLVNIGESVVQIGLINLDENKKMGIPVVNIEF